MHCAASGGNVECIEIILHTFNINVNTRNHSERTPLHYAAEKGHVSAIEKLLKNGANIYIEEGKSHMTPLDYAEMKLGEYPQDDERGKAVETIKYYGNLEAPDVVDIPVAPISSTWTPP